MNKSRNKLKDEIMRAINRDKHTNKKNIEIIVAPVYNTQEEIDKQVDVVSSGNSQYSKGKE